MKTDFLTNLRAIKARSYVRIVGGNREPSWLIYDTLLPLLALSAYVFVYKALGAPQAYAGFVILGGAMTAYWLSVLWSMAAQFYWEKEMGNLELYLIAPVSRISLLLGMAIGGIFMTSVRAVATLILGCLLFRISFAVVSYWKLGLVFVLTLVALYGLGMMFASLYMVWGREAWRLSEVMMEPIYLLSGLYFPIRSLGVAVGLVASFIPLTLGLDGMRQLTFTEGVKTRLLSVNTEIMLLVILGVVFLLGSIKALAVMEHKGKKEGQLTTKWL